MKFLKLKRKKDDKIFQERGQILKIGREGPNIDGKEEFLKKKINGREQNKCQNM